MLDSDIKNNHLIVNPKNMLEKAKQGKYAVGHFNFNTPEEIRAILLASKETKAPVILAITEKSYNFLKCSFKTIVEMVNDFIKELIVDTEVALHFDHCQNVELIKEAIDSGFSSVMYDGSNLPFEENFKNTKEIVKYKFNNDKDVSIEAEVGKVAGKEDNINISVGELANLEEVKKMSTLNITTLAAGFGNIHGIYPKDWIGLNFELLKNIAEVTEKPLVMHGGSGIPKIQSEKAIKFGICKFNIGTQLQIVKNNTLIEYYKEKKYLNKKGYDSRTIMLETTKAIKNKVVNLIKIFGSENKSN